MRLLLRHRVAALKTLVRVLILLTAPVLFSQSTGITPAWDIRKAIESLSAQARRMQPMMDEIKPEEWIPQGAPSAYIDQHKNVRAEIGYLARQADELARDPERMSAVLEVYLRLQSLDLLLNSLSEGVRRYQNPALADLLQGVMSENDANRTRLRTYLVELVATKEAEMKVIDAEAQRCRDILLRQPPPPRPSPKKADRKAPP